MQINYFLLPLFFFFLSNPLWGFSNLSVTLKFQYGIYLQHKLSCKLSLFPLVLFIPSMYTPSYGGKTRRVSLPSRGDCGRSPILTRGVGAVVRSPITVLGKKKMYTSHLHCVPKSIPPYLSTVPYLFLFVFCIHSMYNPHRSVLNFASTYVYSLWTRFVFSMCVSPNRSSCT